MIKNYILAAMFTSVATFSFGQGTVPLTVSPGKSYMINKVETAPVIDGVVDAVYMQANEGKGMEKIDRCTDLSSSNCATPAPATCDKNAASFAVLWDKDFLYIIAEVKDSEQTRTDQVEVFLSFDNVREITSCPINYPKVYGKGDFQVSSTSPAGNLTDTAKVEDMEKDSPKFPIAAYAIAVTATGYIIEIKFDLNKAADASTIFLPEAGATIGFDMSNNQSNAISPNDRASQAMWSADGTNRNWTETYNFGKATLAGPVGVNNMSALVSNISLAPNPANNNVSLKIEAKQQDKVSVSVINSLSQKVYTSEQSISLGSNVHEINTSEFTSGIYTVVISKGNLNTTKKLVINK